VSAPRKSFALAIAVLIAVAAAASFRSTDESPTVPPTRPVDPPRVIAAPAPPTASELAREEASEGEFVPGMRAFKDPKTGALREPEHDEVRTLQRKLARAKPDRRMRALSTLAGPRVLEGPGGAVGVILDESHMSTIVATVGPDGRVSIGHEDNPAAGQARVKGARPAARPQEERHDR